MIVLSTLDIASVSLKSVRDQKPTHIARLEVSVNILNDKIAACRTVAEAAIQESNNDKRLDPNTVLGKVWQLLGRLDALSGIVSKIDQLAKVCLWAYCLVMHYLITRFYKLRTSAFTNGSDRIAQWLS